MLGCWVAGVVVSDTQVGNFDSSGRDCAQMHRFLDYLALRSDDSLL